MGNCLDPKNKKDVQSPKEIGNQVEKSSLKRDMLLLIDLSHRRNPRTRQDNRKSLLLKVGRSTELNSIQKTIFSKEEKAKLL